MASLCLALEQLCIGSVILVLSLGQTNNPLCSDKIDLNRNVLVQELIAPILRILSYLCLLRAEPLFN